MNQLARFKLKTTQLNTRMSPTLKALAEQAASSERLSLSAYLDQLIITDLKARGLLGDEGKPVKAKPSKATAKRK
jgi:hypothetical protein